MTNKIHPTALIPDDIQLGKNVTIEAYTIIKGNVKIGDNSHISSGCVIENTHIGENCVISPYASIGLPPQDTLDQGYNTLVKIGNNVKIREFVTINRGTNKGKGLTQIDDDCYLMSYSHVGHDCHLHEGVTLINNATLGGHVVIYRKAILSAFFTAHQNIEIGELCLCLAMGRSQRNIPPYTFVDGRNAKIFQINKIGLRRDGATSEQIKAIQEAYKSLKSIPTKEALEIIEQRPTDQFPHLASIVDFYRNKAPIAPFMQSGESRED
jgi:UDP-N-acetylglucosamine acyltransferase